MFVKVTKNREGTQYVSIVEGYRDKDKVKHRTIKSLGKLKDLEAGNPKLSYGTEGGRQGRKVSTGARNPFTDPRSEEKDLEPSPELWMVASR